MAKKRRAISRMAEAPTFEVRLLKSARGWYVRVTWRYGQVQDVIGFIAEYDAERWINEKSEQWLRNRRAAVRR